MVTLRTVHSKHIIHCYTRASAGRSPVPEGSLVPVRRHHGLLFVDLDHPADLRRDDRAGGQAQLPLGPQVAQTAHRRPPHPDLPQVFDAEE